MWPRYTAGVAAALLLGAAGAVESAPAESAAARTAAVPVGTVQGGSAPALPPGAKVMGPAPGSQRLHITMALRPSDASGLQQLASQVATPGSAQFRRFLDPAAVQARFGPPATVSDEVRAWLRSQRLATQPVLADGLLLPATGTVKQVEAAFHLTIKRVRLASGRTAYANRQAPRIPADLRDWVPAVVGLDDLHLAKPALTSAPGPGPQACTAARTTRHVYTAAWLAAAYGFDPLYQQGDLGQGVTVALFELADYASGDISTYNRCYGIDPPVRRVRINGGTSVPASAAGTGGVTSDIEVVAGLAPRASILVYEAPASGGDESTVDTYGAIVQQDRAQVVSTSCGGCEALTPPAVLLIESQIFQEMALQGQSMFAAAGDSGPEACPSHHTCTAGGVRKQPCYRATRGYDMATGLGTSLAWRVIGDLLNDLHQG